MKRIKLMLLSLSLFAVVGGALAFKARFNTDFCTTATIPGVSPASQFCPNHAVSKVDPQHQAIFVATTTYDNNECQTPNLKCAASTQLIAD